MEILFDIETDGLDYTKIHCIAVALYEPSQDRPPTPTLFTDVCDFEDWVSHVMKPSVTMWTAHNACGFDYWVLKDLTRIPVNKSEILDTSVISKLRDYNKFSTHSLRELGEHYGVYKGEYDGDWDTYTPEMGDYCVQDVNVLWHIRKDQEKFFTDPDNSLAIDIEHDTAFILAEMQRNGFTFNKTKAERLLDEVTTEMTKLEDAMQDEWPPELVEDRRIQWRMTKAGVPHAACVKAQAAAPKWIIDGDELVLYKYKSFNPGSPKDRVDKLWDAGWTPYDKTIGHYKFDRERRVRWSST